jgi:ribosome-associated translation inhibitor RaiA
MGAGVCAQATPNVIMVATSRCAGRRKAGATRLIGTALAAPQAMRVITEGLGEDRALRTLIAGKILATLTRLRVRATTARVQFTDENGPKGGIDTKCSITIEVPRRTELHADTVADTPRLGFEQAFSALERQIERERTRMREERRRPKKYYLAKRLLEPDASVLEAPLRRAPRRAARRRTA